MATQVIGFLLLLLASGYARDSREAFAILLTDPPVADQVATRGELRATQLARPLQLRQRSLMRELERSGVEVTGSTTTLVNAIFVRTHRERLQMLAGHPGVQAVVPLVPMRHHMDRALPLMRVPAAWEALNGTENAGLGVKIGIIDSGIDHKHPAFQDDALPDPSNPPSVPDENRQYTNRKVIVARSYVHLVDPNDDTTPRDRIGYGTALAAISAGARNRGPSGTITGVAPKAYLGNYKVFTTDGITYFPAMVAALEDALRDGMDVVTIAFGSPALYPPMVGGCPAAEGRLGLDVPSDACDVRAQAIERAVRLGMSVVVSAGNDATVPGAVRYPVLNTIHTPGTAPSAITVGSMLNAFSAVRVAGDETPGALRRIDALWGDGPKPSQPVSARLKPVTQVGNDGTACAALPADSLGGHIALVQRGGCPFWQKVLNAQKAGAIAVIIYQRNGVNSIFNPVGLFDIDVPTVMIGYSSGVALKDYIQNNPDRAVTLDPAVPSPESNPDRLAASSSRGPSIGDGAADPAVVQPAIKPEIVAIGFDIYTATQSLDEEGELFDPSGYTFAQGSSAAVPLVAGAAALVKQKNPGFDPVRIKSAIVNTASPEIGDDTGPAAVTAVGAGKLNVGAAVRATAVVEPATLSFGLLGEADLPISRTLRIVNTGAEAATFALGVSSGRLAITPDRLSLDPGQTGSVAVRLSGDRPEPGSYEGALTIEGGGTRLRVPFLYLVSDRQPHNMFPLTGDEFEDRVDAVRLVTFKLVDRFGAPLRNVPVRFRYSRGGGRIEQADEATDRVGIAAARIRLGPAGEQRIEAEAGGLRIEFLGEAVR